jgi:hypothetical protein
MARIAEVRDIRTLLRVVIDNETISTYDFIEAIEAPLCLAFLLTLSLASAAFKALSLIFS